MTEKIVTYDKFSPDTGEQLVFDPSSFSKFMECPRKYQLSVREGWRSQKQNPATGWGHAVHAGLEMLDKAEAQGRSWDEELPNVLKYLAGDPFGLKGSEDNGRTIQTSMRAIVWYVEQFRDDTLKIAKLPNGEAAVEVRYEVELPGTGKRISGRVDRVVEYGDGLYIVDRKTTKKTLGDWFFRDYQPSLQLYTYVWALRDVIGLPVLGAMIEGIQAAVGFNRFERATYYMGEEQIEEHVRNLAWHASDVAKMEAEGYYPQRFSACGNFGGCEFRDVCSKSGRLRDIYLRADFNQKLYGGGNG